MPVSFDHAHWFFQGMQHQMEEELYHDVEVEVASKVFPCHRFLLASASDFFRAMFRSGMRESAQKRVKVKGMDANTFATVRQLIYTARGDVISTDNMISLWQAACQLQIKHLQETCEAYIRRYLNKDNCIDVYLSAKELDIQAMSNLAWNLILKQFEHLVQTQDIFLLDGEDMVRLVNSDQLLCLSEDTVVDAILRWVKFCVGEYKRDATEHKIVAPTTDLNLDVGDKNFKLPPELNDLNSGGKTKAESKLENICKSDVDQRNNKEKTKSQQRDYWLLPILESTRLFRMSGECLQNLLHDDIVVMNKKVFGIVKKALYYQLFPDRHHAFCPSNAILRQCDSQANAALSIKCEFNGTDYSTTIHATNFEKEHKITFNLNTNTGHPTNKGNNYTAGKNSSAVLYDGNVVETTTDGTNVVSKFALIKNTHQTLASPKAQRNNHALVRYTNHVYVIAGDVSRKSIERLPLNEDAPSAWENAGSLAEPVVRPIAAVYGTKIVVIGEKTGEEDTSTTEAIVQVFDIATADTVVCCSLPGPSETRVFLHIWSSLFVLQGSGRLWELEQKPHQAALDLVLRERIWNQEIQIKAAAIFKDDLVVFTATEEKAEDENGAAAAPADGGEGNATAEPKEDVSISEWSTSHGELFKNVKIKEDMGNTLLLGVVPASFFN